MTKPITAARVMLAVSAITTVLALAAMMPRSQGSVQPEPGERTEAILAKLNDAFRGAYAHSRKDILEHEGPIILAEGDDLVLVRGGKRIQARVLPGIYHDLKAVSHIPLAVY